VTLPVADPGAGAPGARSGPGWEVTPAHAAEVGAITVHRTLPVRARRTVGSWCFADHMGPAAVTESHGLDVGPHPHIGLQTVTWLLDGALLHRDSLGSEQLVRAGELNLMTAGAGVAHAEEATGSYRGSLHGAQLWVALPDATRAGPAAFEHHASLPVVEFATATATVMVGTLAGATSPARADTDHVGAEITLRPGRVEIPVEPGHEHGLVVLAGGIDVDLDGRAGPGAAASDGLVFLDPGVAALGLRAATPTVLLLLGGTPWPVPPLMWWNFVARTHGEIDLARRDWEAASPRFGVVDSPLGRIPAPALPLRLRPPTGR
jgi:redox-sensitive bicupin YhaK (pirin superfamily)